MAFLKGVKPVEQNHTSFGPHGTDFVACDATPLLSELSRLMQILKDKVAQLLVSKVQVGLQRGKLSKENQQRQTASETSVSGVEAVNRLYAFAVARAGYEVAILQVEEARTAVWQFLNDHLVQEPNPLSSDDFYLPPYEDSRWMLSDVAKSLPHPLQLIARHNVASAIWTLKSILEQLVPYREYLHELPEFSTVLWNCYCAHDITRRYRECWDALVKPKSDRR